MFQKSMYLYIVGFGGLRKAINYVLEIYLYIVGFAHVWGRPSTGYPDLRAWSNLHFKADIIFMNIQQADIIFVATGATGGRVNLDKYDVCQQGRIQKKLSSQLQICVNFTFPLAPRVRRWWPG